MKQRNQLPTELTPIGEQYVIPGCEWDQSRSKSRQPTLWDSVPPAKDKSDGQQLLERE